MKSLLLAFSLILGLASLAAAQDATGTWKTEPDDTGAYLLVRIGPCSTDTGLLCGVISQVVGSDRQDIAGRTMIRDMAPNGPGKWNKGSIWAPDDDRTYRSNMRLTGAGLKVEGCVAIFCRGQTWSRAD